jgi:hypothetical protein
LYRSIQTDAPRRYSHIDGVVGLVCSNDPDRYAGGSDVTVMIVMAGRSKVMTQIKKRYLTPNKVLLRNLRTNLG